MLRIRTLIILLFLSYWSFGQSGEFHGNEIKIGDYPALDSLFKDYKVYEFDLPSIDGFVSRGESEYYLKLHFGDDFQWRIQLYPHDIRSSNYKVEIQTENNRKAQPQRENMTYRGYLQGRGGGNVGLTINDHHLAGTVRLDDELYFIEPVHYFDKSAPVNQVVLYAVSDVVPNEHAKCGANEMFNKREQLDNANPDENGGGRMVDCYEVDLAIASDYLMYLDYNQSVPQVEDHNITVMNNVATNWDDEFNNEIQFVIVTQFVSTCNSCDPWTNSTNAGTLLSSFRSWGNSNGFGVSFDLGQLWTDRNLNGSTVGIAYIDGVCTSWKYHVLQDYTTNSNSLRVLTSHEIGHNFDASHDPPNSGFIMAPSVNNTNLWSSASQNKINATINQRAGSCFAACSSGLPPSPDFTSDVTSGCVPLTVNFTDLSLNDPTGWEWTFPGGTPGTSSQQNPTVVYNTDGNFDVTLTVTNSFGSETFTQPFYITAIDVPIASFTSDIFENEVTFTNTSSGGTSWLWEFGDGQTSNSMSPSHIYEEDGTYTVLLHATNECGTSTVSEVITILTLPVPDFTSDVQEGCAPLVVNFIDQSSSNADFWVWTMPGASPDVSTEQNPTVVYNIPGTYDVSLEVINGAGSSSITYSDFITVHPQALAVFVYTVDGLTVNFTNNSENADSYYWDFGDGNNSTEENPSHTYEDGGEYTVSLTATSDLCGDVTFTQTITINGAPVAGFTSDVQEGCAPLTVQFTDVSLANPDTWDWTFEGGNPGTSTAQNPIVVYENPGTYDVTLTVSNSSGQNTVTEVGYIVVTTIPDAGFTSNVSGLNVDFTNISTNADSYSWDFGDNESSTEENPTHTYSEDGDYIVELTATNECGSVTVTQTVTIVTPPTAGFTSDVTTGCAPLTVQFTDQSSLNATSWDWSFPGGNPNSSTAQNPLVVYENPGTYDVTLTVSNSAGQNTLTEVGFIVVTTFPDAGFTSNVNGLEVDFTNTSVNADSYSWDFGDNESSTEENPMHTYSEDGEYTVELTATNECGSVTVSQTITIVTPPTAGFTADVTTGCAALTVQFTDQSSLNATSWEWSFPGGNPSSSTEQNPLVVYDNPGIYDVSLTVSNSAGQNTATEVGYIVVTTVPVAGYTSDVNGTIVDFLNTSTNATSYHWDFGDNEESTDTNPTHDYEVDGEYTVVLTATNECGSVTYTEVVTIVTAPLAGFTADVTVGCSSLTVQFMDESTENTTSWEWSFPGGNPSSSTEQNPLVVYDTPGSYDVTLVASNSEGDDTYTQTEFIIVTTVPTVDFSSSVNAYTVSFLNNSTGATEYLWDFGDNTTSEEPNPEHTYSEPGDYTVTLTATNDCGSVTTTQTVTILAVPIAGFSADVTIGCFPLTVQFTDESIDADSWLWSFPGGSPNSSTEQNPVVTYNNPGSYSVTLEATNSAGSNTLSITEYIIVENIPQPSFTSSITGSIAIFTNTSNGGTSFEWDFGDNTTSTEENPMHGYAEDGDYTVTLTVTNSCGSVTTTQSINITTPPIANFSADITEGCAPLTVQFSDQSTSNTTGWSWSFPGGTPSSSIEQNPVVVYSSSGTFDVTLTVTNLAGSDEATEVGYVIINDIPVADFTSDVNGVTVSFTNNSIDGDTYEWDFGDNESSTSPNPEHQYDEVGDYDVQLIVSNECGADTIIQTVSIQGFAPTAAFNSDERSGCVPFTVQFTDESTEDPLSWDWTFESGNPSSSSEQNPTVVYETPGTYEVSLTVSNAFGENTITEVDYITVMDVPAASFDYVDENGTVTFNNTSMGGTSYDWDFGDGSGGSTEESPVHNYEITGEYKVILIVTNECGSDTIETTIMVIVTGIEDFENIEVFNIFPNPNVGNFTLILEGEGTEDIKFEIYSVVGQIIFEELIEFRNGRFTKDYSLHNTAAGTYIVRLTSEEKVMYKKIVIEQ